MLSRRPTGLFAAAFAAMAAAGQSIPEPMFSTASSGAQNYRGRGGNRAYQRASSKRRNQARHRKACR
jgi:hypothetical protein